MKFLSRLNQIRLALFLVASLALVACGKKASPQAIKQARADWNSNTLVGVYQHSANADAKWDEQAILALNEFAAMHSGTIPADSEAVKIIAVNCRTAIDLGCTDPMVRYFCLRYESNDTRSQEEWAKAYSDVALDMQNSSYPSLRKLFAVLRALETIRQAYPTNANSVPVVNQLFPLVPDLTMQIVQDKSIPAEEVYEACDRSLAMVIGSTERYTQAYSSMEGYLFNNWPESSSMWLLKGEFHINLAWKARGSGYANTVTEDGWKMFKEHLATAAQSLERGWKLNPKDARIALKMMTVELGQGQGHDRMELWFRRAMEADPKDYDACDSKLSYLEPKWYGTAPDMLAFGRECATNQQWGGRVPLILVDAHAAIQRQFVEDSSKATYWQQPGVWPDLNTAFERFFELNPDEIGWYHNYAWYAYKCQQWDKLNELLPKLGPINYNYFGGQEEFEKMTRLAKEHAGKPL